jgi:hypothetical protein
MIHLLKLILESGLRLSSILRSNCSVLEVKHVLQARTDEPGDGGSGIVWISLIGSKNVT